MTKRLPLVQETLETVKKHIVKCNPDEESCQDMKPAIEDCKDKAMRLEDIFYQVIPPADSPRMERYRKAAGKGDRVEVLMREMLKGTLLIAGKPAIKPSTEAQVGELEKALKEVSEIPPSLPVDDSSTTIQPHDASRFLKIDDSHCT